MENLIDDAREIISSERNDVRLWKHAPRLLVFGDKNVEIQVREILKEIEDAVTSPFGSRFFGEARFEALPDNFGEGQQKLWIRLQDGGPSGSHIDLRLGESSRFTTDILIVVAERPNVALMNGLWSLPPSHNRSQLQGGESRCFYSARSRDGVRYGAYVSIYPTKSPEFNEECLWEELLHTLGPLQDALGSKFFSFDNQADRFLTTTREEQVRRVRRKRENDLFLIRALYESGVQPGGSPDVVIDYLRQLLLKRVR